MYVENHGYETKESLDSAYETLHGNVTTSRAALKRSEDGIKALNEQIHYTGQYLANKSVYATYMKALCLLLLILTPLSESLSPSIV